MGTITITDGHLPMLSASQTQKAAIIKSISHYTTLHIALVQIYPLKWGQTSIQTSFEETFDRNILDIYPNPTRGLVSITGQDLTTAEVFNTLGQRVATATGDGERLTVDLKGLPAGVYFVNVTDKDGRKCVRKVVKE